MKKIFRMASAELSKIFMRPSMFVLTGVLIIALVLSFFFFSPTKTGTKFTYPYSNPPSIYTEFEQDYKIFEQELIQAKEDIEEYVSVEETETGDIYKNFCNNFITFENYFNGGFSNTIKNVIDTESSLSSRDIEKCKTAFSTLRELTSNVTDFMISNIKNKKINFFMTHDLYNSVYKKMVSFYDNLYMPDDEGLSSFTKESVTKIYNTLITNYDFKSLDTKITNLEKINIKSEDLKALLDKYFYINFQKVSSGKDDSSFQHTGKLEELYNNFINFYEAHKDTTDEKILAELNEHVARFYDYVQICKALMSNEFELLRIGDKTDDQIASYIGFSGVSKYNLKKEITTSKYFFDNNTFGYEYLTAFNFNKNSGTETNAYDFAFYAMQILSMFIIIFVIFFATSALSGELASGTLKMTATRPYTRNKIFSGKFLACFNVALILITVSLVASLSIGFAMYGFTFQNVLVVANADSLFVTNPIILLLIYLASIMIDIIFYIALAILVSLLFRQTTVSTGITSAIYIVSCLLFGSITSSWIRFVPSLNIGLYRFFTNSNTGMFSYSVVPNTSLLTSGIFTALFIIFVDIFARLLFTHRNLDK